MTSQEFQKRYTYNPAKDFLGKGGLGTVFKAYDNVLDRWVALKIMKVDLQQENIRLSKKEENRKKEFCKNAAERSKRQNSKTKIMSCQ